MAETIRIKVECESCHGTGLYRGFAEPPGVGVVCQDCDGSGCQTRVFQAFQRRKERRDVKTVQRSRGSFIGTGVGPAGGSITYAEFLAGKLP